MGTLASLLAEKRKEKGLSQKEVADHLGVSQGFVSKVELGTRKGGFSTYALKQLADLYDLDFDQLIEVKMSEQANKKLILSPSEEALVLAIRSKNIKKAFKLVETLASD